MGEKKKVDKKGKKKRTGRKHSKLSLGKFYSLSGSSLERKKKFCPRCGPGTFLAQHPKRLYCGRCSYTEFEKK